MIAPKGGAMQSVGDWLHVIWFYKFHDCPTWGWLISLTVLAAIFGIVISVVFFGFDPPSRCNSNGDCQFEY